MERLNDLDRRLIAALRKDGRAPISALAEQLGVSRATVTSRIDKLTAAGIITGFSVKTRDAGDTTGVRALSFIGVTGGTTTTEKVIAALRGFPEVERLHTTNGEWDLVAEVSCSDLKELDVMLRRMREIEGVRNSETSLLLRSVFV
ncbi:Lrp/AsnC family transcriptional regulator [Nesterenkonia flava]|uniref:Lrp/AsnC family transcriptional regulator n=1 Tax=Nesterenkonia flava TaxID=469799 RepID=A0ABU1FUJ1_9MICC|nr:Lrp/AsnC family transcriptional regulator [Nesterenkonia flava]MDR5711922.1 Lrp/AsnC family transcriptional regulator [Nesterenkonia flava]